MTVTPVSEFTKDPDAVLDFSTDWSAWLDAVGVTIASHEVIVPVADGGIVKDSDSAEDGVVTAWLSGGTVGQNYLVTFRVTTSGAPPRTDDRTIRIWVRER